MSLQILPNGSREAARRGAITRAWLAIIGMTLIGGAASVAAWRITREVEETSIRTAFDGEARTYQEKIQGEIALFMDVLDSIRHLHTLSDSISRDELVEFVAKGMVHQQQVLQTFGLALRVPADQRAEFEQADATQTSLAIVEADPAGGFRPAASRDNYYPVTFGWPTSRPTLPDGYDFASSAVDRQAIARMQDTGAIVLGGEVAGAEANDSGRLAYSPIFISLAGVDGKALFYLRGFAFAVLRPGAILHRVIPARAADTLRVELSPAGNGPAPASPEPIYAATITVAGEPWTFRCLARPGFMAEHRSRQPETLLFAGLLVTLLSVLLFAQLAGRTRRIEKLVGERTAALSDANRQLAEEREECLRLEHEILEVTRREKQRVGQDLHDSLGQKLAGAVFLSRALSGHLKDRQEPAREDAEKINEILKDAVAQVRRVARGLAPVELGEGGLPGALKQLAAETCDTYGVVCSLKDLSRKPADARATMHLYHIAQEAVTNAIRHGKAREIVLELEADGTEGRLVVSDNGSGFDPAERDDRGMGLRIMRYRASMFGGAVRIARRSSGGMHVECTFPLGA